MNLFIFVTIWLFVPLAAADAISRERREGTLALLYLTPLGSFGIVVGKTFVHALRSASLFLAMAPWLILPVLFGGVELRDIRMALVLDFTAVLLAMTAGLLASTIPRDWLKSVILAELFAVFLLLGMLNVHRHVLENSVRAGTVVTPASGFYSGWSFSFDFDYPGSGRGVIYRTGRMIELTTNGSFRAPEPWETFYSRSRGIGSDWQQIWAGLTPAAHRVWFHGVAAMAVGAGLVLLATTLIGAWRVAGSWRDTPQPVAISDLRREFLAPRFGVRVLHRKLTRALTLNPTGWLQQYSPSARMVKWAWCLFILVVEIFFSTSSEDLYAVQPGLGLLLLLGLTFSATGSFREELETGAFELLLVTPLRERQVIVGRVRGLWRQFFPAMLVYGVGSIYLASGWNSEDYARQAWLGLGRTMAGFCALPWVGLFFSVQRWNFFVAWLAACLVGLLPAALGRDFGFGELFSLVAQLGAGLIAAVLLENRLRNREFLQRRG